MRERKKERTKEGVYSTKENKGKQKKWKESLYKKKVPK